MKEYGVDGVFMQRFFGVTRGYKNADKPQDKILRNAMEAAKKNGRAIGVMYDLSGLKADGEDCSSVIEDWKMLVDEIKVTNQGRRPNLHLSQWQTFGNHMGSGFSRPSVQYSQNWCEPFD